MRTFAPSPISNWNSVFSHPQFLCFLRRFMPFGVAYFSGRIYKIYTAVARVCVGWKSGRGNMEAGGTAVHVSSVRLVKFPVFPRTCCSLWLCWKTAVQVEPPTFPHSQFRTWFTNFGITFFPTRFSFLTRTLLIFIFMALFCSLDQFLMRAVLSKRFFINFRVDFPCLSSSYPGRVRFRVQEKLNVIYAFSFCYQPHFLRYATISSSSLHKSGKERDLRTF